ncbi:MAG: hypothetical protein PHO62_07770 [Sulfurimonas sp.]|uniref:hypothetical protein n=1 Tax=Sulfurimonas sp. TaxID=2022749 RepID=UPI0026236095|nr:hypothetical protein [Sulfurimonas sp.]MDD5373304.1 hypothetical protein [Sulfurimonas sp.]
MKKILLSVILAASLFGVEYGDEKMDSWRAGFITAYKAMEVDTQQQGLESKPVDVKRYIVYFDAKGDDIAIWDKLMVQMFGYSASVHKPIRTTKDWIIFASSDNKATAMQEMEILNDKIFKNSKKYKLQFFDNDKNEIFYNDKALLTSQLKELEGLLKAKADRALEAKQKELEGNQKVALVYVDKNSGEMIENQTKEVVTPFVTPVVEARETRVAPLPSHKIERKTEEKTNTTKEIETKKAAVSDKTVFEGYEGYVKQKGDNIMFFSRPVFDGKYKVKTALKGEIIAVESKNGGGWYKVKDENLYIAGHLIMPASKADFEKKSDGNSDKPKKIASSLTPMVERDLGGFTITVDSAVMYKLKGELKSGTSRYPVEDFEFLRVVENDYKTTRYSAIIEDRDASKYIKVLGENRFVAYSNVLLTK